MKVLIICTGTIGDVLFATPLIRAIHRQRKGWVELLTTEAAVKVINGNEFVKKVYVFETFWKTLNELSKNSYDSILNLDDSFKSFAISLFLKGKRSGSSLRIFSNSRKVKFPNVHLVDQFFRLAATLGVVNDQEAIDYNIPYRDEVPLEWLPRDFQREYVIFSISAAFSTRRLPLSRMIELCDKINKPVILLGDKTDHEEGQKIEAFFHRSNSGDQFEEGLIKLNKKTRVYNGCGKFNLNQQASLIRGARSVFTFDNDTIPIASAFGKEVVSIWGNTVPAFGRFPYQTRFTILENTRLACRPCSKTGYAKCPLGHFKCMNDIVFDFYL